MISRLAVGASSLLLLLACGCGGGEEIVPATTVTAPQTGGQRPKVARAQPAPPPRAAEPKPAEPQPAPQSKLPPGTSPDDVFEIANGRPNFEVLGPEPDIKPGDIFVAALPPEGDDSSTFVVVTPDARRAVRPRPVRPRNAPRLPDGFRAVADTEYSDTGLPLRIFCEKDQSEMVLVPAGPAVIGTDQGPADAQPRVTVELDAFYIDVHEVTISQYEIFRNWWRENQRRLLESPANAGAASDQPVVGIPWGDARNFAQWAGKELPTEAQWEKAARTSQGFAHPWGNGRALWARPRTQDQIAAVKSYASDCSPYGVYDLAGNAREWCLDWYSAQGHQEAAKKGASELVGWGGVRNPSAPGLRVVKGNGLRWNAWWRAGVSMAERSPTIGFRCVLRIQSAPAEAKGRTR